MQLSARVTAVCCLALALPVTPGSFFCVKAGADVDVTDGNGTTPLHASVFLGRGRLVKALCAAGADPTIEHAAAKLHALGIASAAGHTELMPLLHKHRDGNTAAEEKTDTAKASSAAWLTTSTAERLAAKLGPQLEQHTATARALALAQAARKEPLILPASLRGAQV